MIKKVSVLFTLGLISFITLFFGLSKVDALSVVPSKVIINNKSYEFVPFNEYIPPESTTFINSPLGSFNGKLQFEVSAFYKVSTSHYFSDDLVGKLKLYLLFTSSTTGSIEMQSTCRDTTHNNIWTYYQCDFKITYNAEVPTYFVLQFRNPEGTFGYNDGVSDSSFCFATDIVTDGEAVELPEGSDKLINILEVFKDFYFTPYLFGAMAFLGTMLCIKKIILR